MPSIFDMFDDPAEAPPDAEPLGFDAVLDRVISQRPVAGRPTGYDPSTDGGVSAPQDGDTIGADGGEVPASGAPPPPVPPPPVAETPPALPADPLADGLTDMERLELGQTLQALRDPDRSLAVRRALLGVEAPAAPAPVAAAPAVPAAPQMPEEIMPGSIEAQLWLDNQDMKRQLGEIKAGQAATQQQSEAEARNSAAVRAVQSFSAKYAGRLAESEIAAIAQTAGMRKLPDAFRPTVNNWDEAMNQSLEFELRSNDALLSKVLGVAPAPAAPAAPSGQRTPELRPADVYSLRYRPPHPHPVKLQDERPLSTEATGS